MPGPTVVGLSRSVVARGVIVVVLVAALALVVFAVRRDPPPNGAASGRAPTREGTPQMVPTPGTTGASTCTDPIAKQEWRVTWRATGAAVTLIPTGFAVRPLPGTNPTTPAPASTPGPTLPDGWQSRNDDRWLLRWSPSLADTVAAAKDEKWVRMGPLAVLATVPMSVRQDPRFVTPDGSCSVYLVPFVSGTDRAGDRNTVAVVGDSLVGQLYASEDGTATGAGWLTNRLVSAGQRAEIAGQGGRRWTILPNVGSGLESAEASMLDEIRGLRGARSVVIALGTNDAGWVASAVDQEQYELRESWVILHLATILDELRDHGRCTVLVTMATRNKRYIASAPGRFDAAATRINDYLRERADASTDPHDRLRLWDWATQADSHTTTDPQPWFGRDTIHLSQAGYGRYADALTSAAKLC